MEVSAGVTAVLKALRRDRDEAQVTRVVAAVASQDPRFAADLARALISEAPGTDNVARLGDVPGALTCNAETRVRDAAGTAQGVVDLVFETQDAPGFKLLVELKLHSGYGRAQVQRYLQALGGSNGERTGLVAVTRNVPAYGEPERRHPDWLGSVRWARVLPALRNLSHSDAQVQRVWVAILDVIDARGDFGVTEIDSAAVDAWAHYKKGRGQLEGLLNELAQGALQAIQEELAAKATAPVGDPLHDTFAQFVRRGASGYLVWPYVESVHLRVAIPAAGGRERLRIQFLGGYGQPYFTVEARHEDARRLPEQVRANLRRIGGELESAGFKSDHKTYWARLHERDEWLGDGQTVQETLVGLVREDVRHLAQSGIFDGSQGLGYDCGPTSDMRDQAPETDLAEPVTDSG